MVHARHTTDGRITRKIQDTFESNIFKTTRHLMDTYQLGLLRPTISVPLDSETSPPKAHYIPTNQCLSTRRQRRLQPTSFRGQA